MERSLGTTWQSASQSETPSSANTIQLDSSFTSSTSNNYLTTSSPSFTDGDDHEQISSYIPKTGSSSEGVTTPTSMNSAPWSSTTTDAMSPSSSSLQENSFNEHPISSTTPFSFQTLSASDSSQSSEKFNCMESTTNSLYGYSSWNPSTAGSQQQSDLTTSESASQLHSSTMAVQAQSSYDSDSRLSTIATPLSSSTSSPFNSLSGWYSSWSLSSTPTILPSRSEDPSITATTIAPSNSASSSLSRTSSDAIVPPEPLSSSIISDSVRSSSSLPTTPSVSSTSSLTSARDASPASTDSWSYTWTESQSLNSGLSSNENLIPTRTSESTSWRNTIQSVSLSPSSIATLSSYASSSSSTLPSTTSDFSYSIQSVTQDPSTVDDSSSYMVITPTSHSVTSAISSTIEEPTVLSSASMDTTSTDVFSSTSTSSMAVSSPFSIWSKSIPSGSSEIESSHLASSSSTSPDAPVSTSIRTSLISPMSDSSYFIPSTLSPTRESTTSSSIASPFSQLAISSRSSSTGTTSPTSLHSLPGPHFKNSTTIQSSSPSSLHSLSGSRFKNPTSTQSSSITSLNSLPGPRYKNSTSIWSSSSTSLSGPRYKNSTSIWSSSSTSSSGPRYKNSTSIQPSRRPNSTSSVDLGYSVSYDKNTAYYVYTQNYVITASTTTFQTGLPSTVAMPRSGSSTFSTPRSTVTQGTKFYDNWLKNNLNNGKNQHGGSDVGAIVGGVVGGVCGVLACCLLIWILFRRRRNQKRNAVSPQGFSEEIGNRIEGDPHFETSRTGFREKPEDRINNNDIGNYEIPQTFTEHPTRNLYYLHSSESEIPENPFSDESSLGDRPHTQIQVSRPPIPPPRKARSNTQHPIFSGGVTSSRNIYSSSASSVNDSSFVSSLQSDFSSISSGGPIRLEHTSYGSNIPESSAGGFFRELI